MKHAYLDRYSHFMILAALFGVGLRLVPTNRAHAADEATAAKVVAVAAPAGEQGIVGHWGFDEAQGNAAKDTSNDGNDGAITGAKWTKGVIGSALEFNGVSDYANMRCPGSGITDKAVSVEAWIRSNGNNINSNLVFAGPESLDFGIWIQGGRFFAGVWNSEAGQYAAISARSPTPGQWYHVAMTCDFNADKVVKFYINGELDCTCLASGAAIRSVHTTMDIGGRTPNESYFNGIIDDVRIFNRALSEEEIRKPYADYLERRAQEIDTSGYGNSPWIWTGNPEQRATYFRKSFKALAISGKKVLLICDGEHYQVFLNGKTIIPDKDYSEAQIIDISGDLRVGENVIAAQVSNKKGGLAGFFAYIGYPNKESPGGYTILAAGDAMKCSVKSSDNWHLPDFDDSKWPQCQKVSDFDRGLAIKRNLPDLGLYLKEFPRFASPEFENAKAMRLTNGTLTLDVEYAGKKHNFQVEDTVTHEKWFMPGPPFMIDDEVSAWEGGVTCEEIENGFKIAVSGFSRYPGLRISYALVLKNRSLEVTLDPVVFPAGKKSLSLAFPLDFAAARAGEDGYLVSSIGNYDAREGRIFPFGIDIDRYVESGGVDLRGESTMPVFGIVRRGHPCAAVITDFPAVDYELRTLVRRNSNGCKRLCSSTPIWSFEQDRVNEPRHITYHFLDKGGYVEIAKTYRRFLIDSGRFATLRQRVNQRPVCGLAANASFFWGAYALSEMPDFMQQLKASGVSKAVVQIANKNDFVGGWRRWPEGMTPASGTVDEFRNVADCARKIGYGFSPVDEYTPFADRGQDYDAGLRAMRRDGSFYSFETEKTFFLCESQKLGFAQRDLPHVKEVIGECPYLLDCEGCTQYECFDPRHPLTSRQQILARREFLTCVRDTMGSVVSEGSPIDWLTDVIDVGHGHSLGFQFWESKPGSFIPFWSLVYGGAVVDLFRVPGADDGMLYAALYGLNARFDDYKVGKTQLDWHKRISDAWPERNFFELVDHQFLAPLVQKSEFKENGKVVDVVANFGDVPYLYRKIAIAAHDFQVFVGGKPPNPGR